jgi:hypothetical protein
MSRAWLVLALAGCHFHRDINAPGVIDPLAPPKELTSPRGEYPDDPGEHRLMLTSGVLGGGGGGTISEGGYVDLAGEVTLSYGQSNHTHNDRASPLFIPRTAVIPPTSYGVTLGWSAMRFTRDRMTDDVDLDVGALYVEAQRSWAFAGAGAGWAYDPKTGSTGPQVHGFFLVYFARARALFGEGWEITGGLQFKIPTTWVWRR